MVLENQAYLLFGGNDELTNSAFDKALHLLLSNNIIVTKQSSIYTSDSWGYKSENKYLNMVVKVKTDLSAGKLLKLCLSIEKKIGRIRSCKTGYQDRIIDIDILFFNNEKIATKELIIPHPMLHLRLFTLIPFQEIDSEFIHPTFNKSIEELIKECPDTNKPNKL